MLTSNQKIKIEPDDAPEFIQLINKLNATLIFQYGINELKYIRVKNWFDHKWLNFSGRAVVPFEGGSFFEAALENKWQEKITVPPFHPNRILSEISVIRDGVDNKTLKDALHTYKSSNNNLHNRITQYSQSGLFIWYSSNTKTNDRGSLMVYRVQDSAIETFYVSFENKDGWVATRTKGIGLNEFNVYLSESNP